MSATEIVVAVLFLVILAIALRGIKRLEPDPRQDGQPDAGEELLRLEREMADHGSLGRNFADREIG